MVRGDQHGLRIGVGLNIGDQFIRLFGWKRVGRGFLRCVRRDMGRVGLLIPEDLRAQLLGDKTERDHRPVRALIADHLGGDAIGQRGGDAVDHRAVAVQCKNDKVFSAL